MEYLLIPSAIVLGAAVLVLLGAFATFMIIFFSPRKKYRDEYPTPDGAIYDPYREQMIEWIKEARALPHTKVHVTSHDGLRLSGKYFEYEKGAPIEILFHGYKGTAERDLCGGVNRCFRLGHSALIVDQRGGGESEGRVITFGAKERLDCLAWIDYVIGNIDPDARIILTGISMGASTVLMATSLELPENVIGVLADCGYSSTKGVIKKVMRDMKLPAGLLYPIVRLGARLFGGFDPNTPSPLESMSVCRLPVIFFHGDTDDYVPHRMSEENFAACLSERKRLVTVHGAGHGLAFPVDMELYLKEAGDFFHPKT